MPPQSKVRQAEETLDGLITAGTPGDKLPSEAELAVLAGVSRVTMREAIDRFWQRGALVRRWGAGTFIAEREKPTGEFQPFRSIYVGVNGVVALPAELKRHGYEVTLTSFSIEDVEAPEWIRRDLRTEERMWRVTRCLAIDGNPAVVMYDYLPRTIGTARLNPTELADLEMDITQFLRLSGARIVKHESTLDAVIGNATDCELLGKEPGSPLLHARQRAISDLGETVTCGEFYYRADVFSIVTVRTVAD